MTGENFIKFFLIIFKFYLILLYLFNNLVIFLRIESQYGKDVNVFIDERHSSSVGNCLQFQLLPTIRLPFVPTKSVWKNISLSTVVYLYTGDKKYIILFRAI